MEGEYQSFYCACTAFLLRLLIYFLLLKSVQHVEYVLAFRIHPKCLESLVSVLNGLRLLGKLKEAKEMLSEVNTVLGNLFAVDAVHPVIAKSLLVFGEFARDRGQYDASAAFIERAVSMYTNLYGDTDRNVATCLCSLADSVTCQGKLFEAKKINEQSLEIREVKITMTHADIAQSLAGLAGNYSDLGLYDKALLLYKKAFKIAKRSFGSMNNLLIANVVAGTGSVLTSMGYYTHAEQLHEVASTLRLQLLDRNHPLAATSRSHLSSIYLLQGLPDKAQSGHEEVGDRGFLASTSQLKSTSLPSLLLTRIL